MKKINNYWLLIGIVILAAFLRFWHLGGNPPALTWDEAAWGYNAYSLGQTGRDEFGRLLPWDYLESFGDFKPPVYAYLAVIPVKIFGLNEFATRFPSAFFGVLTVLLVYYLVNELRKRNELVNSLTRNKLTALTASFLLAISPWHIMLSRSAFEANVATFFLVAGVTFFIKGIRKKGWFLLPSAVSFALSLLTFNTARVVAPLLVLGLVVGMRKKIWPKKKWLVAAAMLGGVILLPALPHFFSSEARLRYQEVNIFSNFSVIETSNQEVINDQEVWWSPLIHNRRWAFAREYFRHYFDHFKPDFLFIKGDGNPKFSTQDVGSLYLIELPFLIAGILLMIRKKPGNWWLVFYWLLVGIVPAATARETPHALRIETTLPTWQILAAFGLAGFLNWLHSLKIKKNLKLLVLALTFSLFVINFIYFQHGYWIHYPVEFSGEWQYGYRPALDYIKSVQDDYDQVWFTNTMGRPYVYFLFHLKISPRDFRETMVINRDPYGFVEIKSFGKYHFFREPVEIKLKGKTLVVDLPRNIEEKLVVNQTFSLLNGSEILAAHDYTIKPEYLEKIRLDENI